jgi:hypothetical protein
MLSHLVAVTEQNSPVLARATEIVAPASEELAFIKPATPPTAINP